MPTFSFSAFRLVLAALPLAVAGCVSAPGPTDIASTQPADASAAISPIPPLQTGLLSSTNIVPLRHRLESAPAAPDAPEAHEAHEAKPGAEEKK